MKILDLFCGAGGAAMGLHRYFPDAEITGVDVRPQKHYPFVFAQADAMEYPLDGFDFIWASPPCQEHTAIKHIAASTRHGAIPEWHIDRLDATRERLQAQRSPWIIENVVGAPLAYSAELCGLTFGLRVYRHRRFEAPFMLMQPLHLRHRLPAISASYQGLSRKGAYLAGIAFASVTGNTGSYAGPGMGINWMTGDELSQAIPPAYSEYLAQFIPINEGGTAMRNDDRNKGGVALAADDRSHTDAH